MSCLPYTVWVLLQDLLLLTCKIPYPISCRCLCHFLWAPSLVSQLGSYQACRPVGFSPTALQMVPFSGVVWKQSL